MPPAAFFAPFGVVFEVESSGTSGVLPSAAVVRPGCTPTRRYKRQKLGGSTPTACSGSRRPSTTRFPHTSRHGARRSRSLPVAWLCCTSRQRRALGPSTFRRVGCTPAMSADRVERMPSDHFPCITSFLRPSTQRVRQTLAPLTVSSNPWNSSELAWRSSCLAKGGGDRVWELPRSALCNHGVQFR